MGTKGNRGQQINVWVTDETMALIDRMRVRTDGPTVSRAAMIRWLVQQGADQASTGRS